MRAPRPWHFFFLVLPYGASFGFVSVALPYIARQRGIAVGAIGAVVAAAFAPHAPKFLWAPAVDVTWSRKGWYLLALALVSLAPHQAWAYATMTLVCQALNGAAFAAFSTFAFQTAGTGAVATKYNVFASLANTAIAYMTRVDSAAHARWGGSGVLLTDAAMTGVGIAGLAVVVAVTRKPDERPASTA